MRRRDFTWGMAASLSAGATGARAQSKRRPIVGYLAIGTLETRAHYVAAFHKGLGNAGMAAGRDLDIEFRWAGERRDSFGPLAAELVERKVDVILAASVWAAEAAVKATREIPIVFTIGSDAITAGLVASYRSPGGNATGFTFMATELAPKRLELLQALAPGQAISLLLNARNVDWQDAQGPIRSVMSAASALGVTLLPLPVSPHADMDGPIADARARGAGALLVANDPGFNGLYASLPKVVMKHRLPAMYYTREFTEGGGLASYGTNYADIYRQAGGYVARVLKGDKPADLPVQQPTRFELVLNLKTAKALGLEMPATLLAIADEVIE